MRFQTSSLKHDPSVSFQKPAKKAAVLNTASLILKKWESIQIPAPWIPNQPLAWGFVGIMEKKMETTNYLGFSGYIGSILGLCEDNGKANGNYYQASGVIYGLD